LAIAAKEAEVATRVAASVAAREADWAKKEANMQALLGEREAAARAAAAEAAAATAEARAARASAAAAASSDEGPAGQQQPQAEASTKGRFWGRSSPGPEGAPAATGAATPAVAAGGAGSGPGGDEVSAGGGEAARRRSRRVSVLHQSSSVGDEEAESEPYLTLLSRDASLSRTASAPPPRIR